MCKTNLFVNLIYIFMNCFDEGTNKQSSLFVLPGIFLPWPLPEGQAMVLPPPCRAMGTSKITDKNRHVCSGLQLK
jgi:hypothetical protein